MNKRTHRNAHGGLTTTYVILRFAFGSSRTVALATTTSLDTGLRLR